MLIAHGGNILSKLQQISSNTDTRSYTMSGKYKLTIWLFSIERKDLIQIEDHKTFSKLCEPPYIKSPIPA